MPRGGSFYDAPGVLERYRERRPPGVSDPILVMEEPALLEALGSVERLRVLDLGCGDAALGRVLLSAGCACYLGVDGSARMVEAARETLRGTPGEVERGDIEDFAAAPGAFDVVISRMALHYVADIGPVLAACHACLAPGGRVVITVVHPVVSSHDARASTDQLRADWVVDDYFAEGPRALDWLGGSAVWHHRTIEAYVAALQDAGFAVAALRECAPRRERFGSDQAEYARRARIPLFLLLAGARVA